MSRRNVIDTLQAFYPVGVTILVVPFAVVIGYPWLAIVVLLVVLALWRTWWTCVAGLANSMLVLGGIIACLIPYAHMLREYVSRQ